MLLVDDPEYTEEDTQPVFRCFYCGVLWHEASGMLVGYPTQFHLCGRCWREVFKCLKAMVSRDSKKWSQSGEGENKVYFYPSLERKDKQPG